MAADHRGNGTDPFPPLVRTQLPQRQRLGEIVDPVPEEAFEGPVGKRLATAVTALVARSDQRDADDGMFQRDVFGAFERNDRIMQGLHGSVNELKVLVSTGHMLPPMRPESPSSAAVPDHSRKSFGEFLRQRARETPGGPGVVQAPTEEIEQAAQRYFEEQMGAYEQGQKLKKLAAKELEDKAALERRRTFWALTISATIAALVTVLGTYFATKATEHEKGFAEGFKAAPTTTVVVAAAPEESASSVRAFAPSAPAAVAPHAPAK